MRRFFWTVSLVVAMTLAVATIGNGIGTFAPVVILGHTLRGFWAGAIYAGALSIPIMGFVGWFLYPGKSPALGSTD